jgi:hypothetical protein
VPSSNGNQRIAATRLPSTAPPIFWKAQRDGGTPTSTIKSQFYTADHLRNMATCNNNFLCNPGFHYVVNTTARAPN